jgi:hypothetical protein
MTLRVFLATHWGDVASLAGLALTIWAVFKTKKAAEQARDAAQQVKDRIASLDTLADVSAAITIMDEIKRLQRLGAWQIVLDRYSILRRHLIRVEQLNPALGEIQRRQIARAIGQFRIIETKVEEAMSAPENGPADAVAFNRIVSAQIDAIERIMTAIKQAGV